MKAAKGGIQQIVESRDVFGTTTTISMVRYPKSTIVPLTYCQLPSILVQHKAYSTGRKSGLVLEMYDLTRLVVMDPKGECTIDTLTGCHNSWHYIYLILTDKFSFYPSSKMLLFVADRDITEGDSTEREGRGKAEERIITKRSKETNLNSAIASYKIILCT